MLNQAIIVGKIKEIGEDFMIVGVPRAFKNENGEYDTDFIKCSFGGNVAKSTNEYCATGDIVGVKGRIASLENGMEIVAEKVTFLSSRKAEEDED